MALSDEQRTAFTQLFRDIDTYCQEHPESTANELQDAIYPILWSWANTDGIRRAQAAGRALQEIINKAKQRPGGLGTGLAEVIARTPPSFKLQGTITGRIPSTPNEQRLPPLPGLGYWGIVRKARAGDYGPDMQALVMTAGIEPPAMMVDSEVVPAIEELCTLQYVTTTKPPVFHDQPSLDGDDEDSIGEQTMTYISQAHADLDDDELDDDELDEDEDCEGHESLDGAHMGESVYCDGSCKG